MEIKTQLILVKSDPTSKIAEFSDRKIELRFGFFAPRYIKRNNVFDHVWHRGSILPLLLGLSTGINKRLKKGDLAQCGTAYMISFRSSEQSIRFPGNSSTLLPD